MTRPIPIQTTTRNEGVMYDEETSGLYEYRLVIVTDPALLKSYRERRRLYSYYEGLGNYFSAGPWERVIE